jgi:N-acetylmuramoyl-L-alanine amidase
MAVRKATNKIIIHTSATRANMDIGAKEIRSWHKGQGWTDIGYHFVIRRNGVLEKGRAENAVGAHVAGHNSDSIGICLVGGLNTTTGKAERNYTDEQYKTLRSLVSRLVVDYPNAKIYGHRDFSPDTNKNGVVDKYEWFKECPCFSARNWAWAEGFPIDTKLRVSDDQFVTPTAETVVTHKDMTTTPLNKIEIVNTLPEKRPTTLVELICNWWNGRKK